MDDKKIMAFFLLLMPIEIRILLYLQEKKAEKMKSLISEEILTLLNSLKSVTSTGLKLCEIGDDWLEYRTRIYS